MTRLIQDLLKIQIVLLGRTTTITLSIRDLLLHDMRFLPGHKYILYFYFLSQLNCT